MADRKDSELDIKSTIVAGDLFPVLDSETAVDADKNKTVAATTIKKFAVHDYGIIHIDFNNGLDTSPASETLPVKTLQKAIDIYEASGGSEIKIHSIGNTVAGQAVISASSGDLIISGIKRDYEGDISDNETKILSLKITDKNVIFKDISVGILEIVQTGTNDIFIQCVRSNITTITETIATPAHASIMITDNSKFTPTGTIATPINVNYGSLLLIGTAVTLTNVNMFQNATLNLALAFTSAITTLNTEGCFVQLVNSSALDVVDFTHNGTRFQNQSLITVSGTESGITGEF